MGCDGNGKLENNIAVLIGNSGFNTGVYNYNEGVVMIISTLDSEMMIPRSQAEEQEVEFNDVLMEGISIKFCKIKTWIWQDIRSLLSSQFGIAAAGRVQ